MINEFKGWMGEKCTTLNLWVFLDPKRYHRIDNVIVPSENGTTQIDHILVSVYGIFVIETKNIKGRIYAPPNSAKWTQYLSGKKSQFQNPIKQNYRHTKCLSDHLKLNHAFFRPLVFFIGDCEFKTDKPANVIDHDLAAYIRQFKKPCLSQKQVDEAIKALRQLKMDRSLTKKAHLKSLQERHNSTTVCPKCGKQLVERTTTKCPDTGRTFIGCSGWPKCKYTRDI